MKEIINKKSTIIILITTFLLLLLERNSFAMGLQARDNNNPLYNKSVSQFFELIRAMETPTGTLGKNSNINTNTDYLDTTGNGIDCHLQKNTEYGTITLLGASEYGNIPNNNNNYSTGNNNTGVHISGNYYVANTFQTSEDSEPTKNSYNEALVRADDRYKNKYIGTEKYSITGDGLIETDDFHSGYKYYITNNYPVFGRNIQSFFGYNDYTGYSSSSTYAHAVVVCGPGL